MQVSTVSPTRTTPSPRLESFRRGPWLRCTPWIRRLIPVLVTPSIAFVLAAATTAESAWAQLPRAPEWSLSNGGSARCPGLEPGTIGYRLRCPGGYPITTPWILGPGVGLVVVGAGLAIRRRRRAGELEREELPPLIFAPPKASAGTVPNPAPQPDQVAGLPPPIDPAPPLQPRPYPAAAEAEVVPPAPPASEIAEDATIQLLPGRLRIVAGDDMGREFRFARIPGQVTEVTIGRQHGEAPHHIQLVAPTVSRLHARMRFLGGGWKIENLSETNPLVINGQMIAAGMTAPQLSEGDRIEIGEFVLVYHER